MTLPPWIQSRLLRHLFSMSMVQAIQVLLPLAVFPYLIRALGIEPFGRLNYALAIIHFGVVVVDYGLTLTGTRDVAVHRHDPHKLSVLFSTKWSLQIMLMLALALVLLACTLLIPKWWELRYVLAASFLLIPANMLLPTWLLQGMEAFAPLAWFNLLNRASYALLVVLLVDAPNDLLLVALLNAGTALVAGLAGWWWVRRAYSLQYHWPGWIAIRESMSQGWSVFISSFSITLYTHSAMLILGFFAGDRALGIYAAVEKLILAFRLGLSSLFAVIFPRVSQLAANDATALRAFLQKIQRLLLPGVGLGVIGMALLAQPILQLVTGKNLPEAVQLLHWMAPIPVFVAFNLAPYQLLLAHHHQKWYARILLLAAVVGIGSNLLLAPQLEALGTGISVVLAEAVIAFGLLLGTEWRYRSLSLWRKSL